MMTVDSGADHFTGLPTDAEYHYDKNVLWMVRSPTTGVEVYTNGRVFGEPFSDCWMSEIQKRDMEVNMKKDLKDLLMKHFRSKGMKARHAQKLLKSFNAKIVLEGKIDNVPEEITNLL
jgi:hypothetical protein